MIWASISYDKYKYGIKNYYKNQHFPLIVYTGQVRTIFSSSSIPICLFIYLLYYLFSNYFLFFDYSGKYRPKSNYVEELNRGYK